MKAVLLLGSGFSSPAGYKMVPEINNEFLTNQKIRNPDNYGCDGAEFWYIGKPSPNREIYRWRVQPSLHYLFSCIDKYASVRLFDYEWFYQYFLDNEHLELPDDNTYQNCLTLYKLIAKELIAERNKPCMESHYTGFIDFCKELHQEMVDVTIATFNHDSLLESLFSKNDIPYSDGFSFEGSKIFASSEYLNGKNYDKALENNKVREFNGQFGTDSVKVIHLHGAFDHLRLHQAVDSTNLNSFWIKKSELPESTYYSRNLYILNLETNQFKHQPFYSSNDFLVGKNIKDKNLLGDMNYQRCLELFKSSLQAATHLLSIGFSFGDDHIVSYINEYCGKDVAISLFGKRDMSTVLHSKFSPMLIKEHLGEIDFKKVKNGILPIV
jgi:hypothetical protein